MKVIKYPKIWGLITLVLCSLYTSITIASVPLKEADTMEWKDLELTVSGIETNRGGDVVVMIFREDGFPKEHQKAIKTYRFSPQESEKKLMVQVTPGEFAIKIHHDEDQSNSVTKNWTGIFPAEGLGFSSGAKIQFGPPSFKKAKMIRPENGTVTIAIRYP